MLNYAGEEYCEYGGACQAEVTVIRSSDAALKSCLKWLTMSCIIGDSAYHKYNTVLQTVHFAVCYVLHICISVVFFHCLSCLILL